MYMWISGGPVPQRPRSSVALILLASGLTGSLLYFARAAFIPVALAFCSHCYSRVLLRLSTEKDFRAVSARF
jgi:hypothetical protein